MRQEEHTTLADKRHGMCRLSLSHSLVSFHQKKKNFMAVAVFFLFCSHGYDLFREHA
jgi:hypothetical protein